MVERGATGAPARVEAPIPITRPRGRVEVVAAVVVAAGLGLAAGTDPGTTLLAVSAVVSAAVLVVRVDLAALALVGAAVFEHYLSWVSPWALEWVSAVLLVAWGVRRAAGPLHDRRSGVVLVPASLFAVTVFLSAVGHFHGRAGVEACGRDVLLLLVLLVLADVMAGPLSPHRAVRVYVVSCVLAALCGIVTALVGAVHVVSGPLARPEDLAFFLVAAVPLVGSLRRGSTSRASWPVWAAAAVLVVAILGTQSRAAWVALAVVLVLAAGARVLSLRRAGLLLVLVATGAAFAVAVQPHTVGDAVVDQQRYAETRLSERVDRWRAEVEVVRDSPALGLGPGAPHREVRSTPIAVATELGLLGAGALLAVFVVPVVQSLRRRPRTRSGPVTDLALALALGMSGAGVAALFEGEQLRLPLWFLAAAAAALGRADQPSLVPFSGRGAPAGGPGGGRTTSGQGAV